MLASAFLLSLTIVTGNLDAIPPYPIYTLVMGAGGLNEFLTLQIRSCSVQTHLPKSS